MQKENRKKEEMTTYTEHFSVNFDKNMIMVMASTVLALLLIL